MEHVDVPRLFGLLAVLLVLARTCGFFAIRLGQPGVLGELLAGVLAGASGLGLVQPGNEILHVLAELGVALLLFQIGLETDLLRLLSVGPAAALVAVVGVALPFLLGWSVCLALGKPPLVAIVVGAALTATSVGITARVLADLGRLRDPEGQVILGAAVLDDVIGLVILTVVAGLTTGAGTLSIWTVLRVVGLAVGFLVVAVVVGQRIVPVVLDALSRRDPAFRVVGAVSLALGMAWLASMAGSALIIGAFVAGLLVRKSAHAHTIEHGAAILGSVFVPLFFVQVGSAVDVRVLDPFLSANHSTLLLAGLLIVVAVIGKFLAGYAPFWMRGNKALIGAGMIPRGEVGLIFAQMGLTSGLLDASLFSAVTLTVMATTFLAPPLLRRMSPAVAPVESAAEETISLEAHRQAA